MKACPICTKEYVNEAAYERHVTAKHKGYIPKSVRGRAFKKLQVNWPIQIFSGQFESSRKHH